MLNTKINASAIASAIVMGAMIVPSINDGNAPWKVVEKDSQGNPLEPGALYCKCLVLDDECDAISFGSLVRYGSDGRFYNADYCEEMEEDRSDYDFLVRQIGDIDQDYIF